MAEMIPDSLSGSKDATSGERRLFLLLREALQPHADFIVWYEPKAADRRPDFLVWSRQRGLLVIETKDWSLSRVVRASPDTWTVRWSHGEQEHDNPIEQARKCYIRYSDLLHRSSALCQPSGTYKGKLKFPIGYCVIFTNLTRRQAEESRLAAVLPPTLTLFQDDLGDPDNPAAQLALATRLGNAFPVRFPFPPLEPEELQTLRSIIFPEVRIPAPPAPCQHPLRSPEHASMMRALDLTQERIAKSIADGHRILKGVAGSGKTLVLACRARYLKRLHPEWRVLVVCYNISLAQHLRQLTASSPAEGPVEVAHFHELVSQLSGKAVGPLPDEPAEQYDARIGDLLLQSIECGKVRQRYEAILIDEGQDFTTEWIRSLVALLNPDTDSLLFSLDPAQDIFGRKITFRSLGIKVQGRRPVLLPTSYRNTAEILGLARRFSRVVDEPRTDTDDALESTLFPIDADRHGKRPLILEGIRAADQVLFVLDEIAGLLRDQQCDWRDIGVLYVEGAGSGFARSFVASFARRFPKDRLYWITESRQTKRQLDPCSDSVKLSTVESTKGLEFRVVFLLGMEHMPRPLRDAESERKLAYVGLTRAQDLLYILGDLRKGLFGELIEQAAPEASSRPTTTH